MITNFNYNIKPDGQSPGGVPDTMAAASDPTQSMVPVKEHKETVIRANNVQAITTILSTCNISLQANKNQGGPIGTGGRKNEDGTGKPGESKRKKHLTLVCTSLFLNNNEIRTIKGLRDILNYVVWQPEQLEWLDLSYNYL